MAIAKDAPDTSRGNLMELKPITHDAERWLAAQGA